MYSGTHASEFCQEDVTMSELLLAGMVLDVWIPLQGSQAQVRFLLLLLARMVLDVWLPLKSPKGYTTNYKCYYMVVCLNTSLSGVFVQYLL